MTRYIALLRGINIGKSGRIRMDALKRVFEDAGFAEVETYIQSGNVLFSTELPEADAREHIERAMKERTQLSTTAVLRTDEALFRLVDQSPFSAAEREDARHANPEFESGYICLMPQPPQKEKLDLLAQTPSGGDAFAVVGRDIYLLLRQGLRQSRLAIRVQRVFPDATVRNWNTISKLNELCRTRRNEES